jgi:hypothetical protein
MSDPRNAPGFLRPAQYHRRLYHIRSSGGQSARSGVMSAHDDGRCGHGWNAIGLALRRRLILRTPIPAPLPPQATPPLRSLRVY